MAEWPIDGEPITVECLHNGTKVACSHFVLPNRQVAFTVELFDLYDHELDLNRGRLVNFRHDTQAYKASFTIDMASGLEFAGLQFRGLPHLLTCMVNWIAEHGRDKLWSIRLRMILVKLVEVTFSFEDGIVGVYFKLAWL